ncbi:helix-turn-helix transcriptional regulator (plasmid) [Acidiphilium multivorum]|uniref:helix-turn-helix domain-containing protein n=1 Tax=Acidiphilium multivorum TaxID=62140 RepID=UPI001F4C25D9|nr:helix-turn-helix transcriptional regulator [Acidiphilium multivorum]UNC16309.1 helix-turn-helix transcriptional regulator [Acidiphilium multivorum]
MANQTSPSDRLACFGQQIRSARIAAGLRQADLADMVGTRQATISDLERGRLNIHLDLALNLMQHLGIRIMAPDTESDAAPISDEALSVPDIDDIMPPPS